MHAFEKELAWSHEALTGEPPIYDPEEVHGLTDFDHSTPERIP